MSTKNHDNKSTLSNKTSGGFWKCFLFTLGAILFVVLITLSSIYVWAQKYDGHIPPNVWIGNTAFGGMDPEDARMWLLKITDSMLNEGVLINVLNEEKTLAFVSFGITDVTEDLRFDIDGAILQLMKDHDVNPFIDTLKLLQQLTRKTTITVPLVLNEDNIKERIKTLYPDAEIVPQNAAFNFTKTDKDWTAQTVESKSGRVFIWKPFFNSLSKQLSIFDTSTLSVVLEDAQPSITSNMVNAQIEKALSAVKTAPYSIISQDGNMRWELSSDKIISLIAPGENGELTLIQNKFEEFVQTVSSTTDLQPQDARIEIINGRVVDFVESKNGQHTDTEKMENDLLDRVRTSSNQPIELLITMIEPEIKIEDVNDLGIKEVLGVGTSSYKGSPINRKANIQNGVNLLNGKLIAPGSTFSLLSALSPFTQENGYLPELVIRGDKIIPELGGGLCQIGTTTFRATMHAGLPILERQNHSIVVSYYNDTSNGNPGTDATIYEPAPDFKFLNDTGNYILFQAENVTGKQELRFAFWGTSDGRKGSYSAPVVTQWIPVGETQKVETIDLEPGVEKCQTPHIGADATFVYSVSRTDGSIEQTEFASHYRPLPEICLIGVEKISEEVIETTDAADKTKDPLIPGPPLSTE